LRIDRFASTKFRNLEHEPVSFSPRVNLFVGPNGHGKTNILEALQFFQFGRSFRAPRDNDLIRFDEPFCRVEVGAEMMDGSRDELAVSIERTGGKRIKLSGKDVGRYTDLIGRYPCVLFGPHDLAVVSGFPAERRRFIDSVGSMTDRVYLDGLRAYRRVLKQRNAALKSGRAREALGVWTEELIKQGCAVTERRLGVLDALVQALQPHIDSMNVAFVVDIQYESELAVDRPEEVSLEEQFAARLSAVEQDEVRRRVTLVGPHRDDIRLLADGRDLRRFGSQGQRRLMAILLRLAELSYTEARLKEPSVLLLDDLFSELDDTVAGNLKRVLATERQIFVTSPVPVGWEGSQSAQTFQLSDGRISAGG